MATVDDKEFNSIFISHAHDDKDFARQFGEKLQDKLGNSIHVWLDDYLLEGKEWRREIQQRLNSAALVIVILSPDSLKSPWVLYEWHYSLLIQQSEPFLVHFRSCLNEDLNRFTDYQIPDSLAKDDEQAKSIWTDKANDIDQILEKIVAKLQGFSELRKEYGILTNIHGTSEDAQSAAYNLGNVSEGLKLAAANYLIEAFEFWLSYGIYGPVGASITNALGRLGKRKATHTLVQFFLQQANPPYQPALNSVQRALSRLVCEDPL